MRVHEVPGNELWRYCDGKRPVLLHYHIYKNAGTTVEDILGREFGLFYSKLDSADANATVTQAELVSFLEAHENVVALSSHQIHYPKPVSERIEFFDLCLIRHPFDRLFSQYAFLRKSGVDDPLCSAAKATDLAGFLSFLGEHHPEYICNAQTNLLLHAGSATSLGSADLKSAQALLADMALVGTVEHFDETLMLAEYTLHPIFPRLTLFYFAQNVTNSGDMHFERRLEVIRSRCGERLYRRLLESNELDLVIWRNARAELQRRLGELPDHDLWLDRFRARNEQYQGRPRLRDRIMRYLAIRTPGTPGIVRPETR